MFFTKSDNINRKSVNKGNINIFKVFFPSCLAFINRMRTLKTPDPCSATGHFNTTFFFFFLKHPVVFYTR